MSGEPTPPLVPVSSEPPPPVKREPRNPIGWIVSGLLLYMSVVTAVTGYVNGGGDSVENYEGLQSRLKYQVSLKAATDSPVFGALAEGSDRALEHLSEQAAKDAPKSDAAARVAVVAAYEAGGKAPEAALKRLAASKSETSQLMARFYAGEDVARSLSNSIDDLTHSSYVTDLAQVEAMEKMGLPSGRDKLVDKGLPLRLVLFMLLGFLALSGGGFVLLWFLSLRTRGLLKPAGFGGWTKADGDRMMVRFAAYFIIFVGVSVAARKLPGTPWYQAATLAVVGLLAITALMVPVFGKQDSPVQVVGPARPTGRLVGLGLLGYLSIVPITTLVIFLAEQLSKFLPTPHHPITEEILNAGPTDWVAIALTAVLIGPVIEEFFFRGVLLPSLAPHFKRALWPILICGFVFAAVHPQGPLIWPALIAVGSVSAYLRYYTGSLVPSFVMHIVYNGVIIFVSLTLG